MGQKSTYVQNPPYFVGMGRHPRPVRYRRGPRALPAARSITTDHISPAGTIKVDSPAGKYLIEHKVKPADFNQYGTRRGNHEVMMRGTFANIRLKNQMVPGVEGGVTVHYPSRQRMSIFDAAMRYKRIAAAGCFCRQRIRERLIPGLGGERPEPSWRTRGLCQSFERIHRSTSSAWASFRSVSRRALPGSRLAQGRRTGDDPWLARRDQAAPAHDR